MMIHRQFSQHFANANTQLLQNPTTLPGSSLYPLAEVYSHSTWHQFRRKFFTTEASVSDSFSRIIRPGLLYSCFGVHNPPCIGRAGKRIHSIYQPIDGFFGEFVNNSLFNLYSILTDKIIYFSSWLRAKFQCQIKETDCLINIQL